MHRSLTYARKTLRGMEYEEYQEDGKRKQSSLYSSPGEKSDFFSLVPAATTIVTIITVMTSHTCIYPCVCHKHTCLKTGMYMFIIIIIIIIIIVIIIIIIIIIIKTITRKKTESKKRKKAKTIRMKCEMEKKVGTNLQKMWCHLRCLHWKQVLKTSFE